MGGSTRVSGLLAAILAGICGLFLTGLPSRSAVADEWRARVAPTLQLYHDTRRPASSGPARFDAQGRVEADVHYNCASSAPPTKDLAAAGLSIGAATRLPPLCVVEGWVAPEALPTLAAVGGVTRIQLPSYARHVPRPSVKSTTASQSSSTIDGNAITIMRADQFVSQAGGGGNGVTVGVQSQGVASLSTIQGRHELPAVQVLTSAAGGTNNPYGDEGTVLLEEIHAVAPNAGLAFCEPQTFVQYTGCLQQFANVGATVMVDDILFYNDQDPMAANGTNAQALTQFLANNPHVALFTAAGNDNGSYWEGAYTPVALSSQSVGTLTCPGSSQADTYANQFQSGVSQVLTNITTSVISVPLTFAWADPAGHNVSNFDVYWQNTANPTQIGCLSSAGATGTVITQTINLYPGTNVLYIATPDASMSGKFLKLWVGGDGLTTLSDSTAGSFLTPQTFASGVITVGAVNGSDGVGNTIEPFSSKGPISVVFPSPAKIQAPILVAPDGIHVDATNTYFASTLFPDGNFYGTSAAAPNAAAVAALIRGAFPNLTVAQLVAALQTGAAQLGASAPDNTFGYGRVDAMGALGTFPVPTITSLTDVTIDASASTTSAAIPFTVSSAGPLHFSVSSTNSALVPTAVGASGTPGIAVTPADCGTSTVNCSLTVTAAPYQGGTATLTVSAVDGAGRAAPATMQVTVKNPQTAPPPPPTPSGGGGSLDLWELGVMSAMGLAQIRRRRRNCL